jgi:acetylornithine deacetylase/succinyl-diaminopimelate desuccinylase-like protein
MHQELLSRLDADYTLGCLEEMITIPSIVGREGELGRYLQAELRALGLDPELHEVEGGRYNVYARLRGQGPGRRLNLNGHTDTVAVCEGWQSDPFRPVRREGRLYGLGACDMKAGIACILTALKAFVESGHPFQGELSFSGVVDEEGYSQGARAMMSTDLAGCDAILLAEPYAGDAHKPIPLGITGKVLYELLVQGHAAHGFHPEEGINAIEEAARIVAALDRLPMGEHPDFQGNCCTLKIEGGYQAYSVVVPDRCRVEINRLLVPGETTASAMKDMESLVASLGLRARVEVGVKPPRYEPFVLSREEPILQCFEQVYRQVMGVAPVYEYSQGITDANVFAEHGIPCLHLGPPRGDIHQPNEYVLIDSLPRVAQMYALLAAGFLGEP